MSNYNQEKIDIINNNDILPNRYQPRKKFSEDELLDLTESIKKYGILEPIIIRKLGDKYELIAGERRYKANVLAGNENIPAIVKDLNDADCSEIAIIENLQRKELSPLEEALSYKRHIDMGYATQQQLAEKVGKSQSYIANKIRLLKLSDKVQDALMENKISERHARSLLRLDSLEQQNEILNKIINERLTVRKTDEEIDKMNNTIYNNDNFNNGDQLQTTPLSTIFNENQNNNQQINENGVFKFGPENAETNNQVNDSPALMSFDVDGNPVNNFINPANPQVSVESEPISMFNNGVNATEPTIGNMPPFESQVSVQPESISMFNNGVNATEPTVGNIPPFESQVSVQPESISMFNNGVNTTEPTVGNMPPFEPQASVQPEPISMFNNEVNTTEPTVGNIPPFESQVSVQPEPISMFNNGVNATEPTVGNIPPFESQINVQPEPITMFNNGVNATEPTVGNIPPFESQINVQPEPITMFNNGVNATEPTIGNIPPFESQVNVQPEPFNPSDVQSNNENKESDISNFDLNNANSELNGINQSLNQNNDGFNLNGSAIPSTPIFDNNQSSDTIAEFKKPEPIIVTDYSKQYDPVMPKQKPKAPDIDLKTIINLIRQCSDTIEKCGYKIDTEEYDLENMYQVVFKIDKIN